MEAESKALVINFDEILAVGFGTSKRCFSSVQVRFSRFLSMAFSSSVCHFLFHFPCSSLLQSLFFPSISSVFPRLLFLPFFLLCSILLSVFLSFYLFYLYSISLFRFPFLCSFPSLPYLLHSPSFFPSLPFSHISFLLPFRPSLSPLLFLLLCLPPCPASFTYFPFLLLSHFSPSFPLPSILSESSSHPFAHKLRSYALTLSFLSSLLLRSFFLPIIIII